MFSLFDALKEKRTAPFVLASDNTQVYRLRGSGLEKYDSAGKQWNASADSYDVNADLFDESDAGAYRITYHFIVLPKDESQLDGLTGKDLLDKLNEIGYRTVKEQSNAVKL